MKRIAIPVLFALCLLLPAACQRTEKRVRTVAETFLNAYYTGDYQAASACCTPDFGARVAKGARLQAELPADVIEKMKEAVSKTSFNIVSVEMDPEGASARVRYALQVPGLEKPVSKSLHLQLEGKTACVDRIE